MAIIILTQSRKARKEFYNSVKLNYLCALASLRETQ